MKLLSPKLYGKAQNRQASLFDARVLDLSGQHRALRQDIPDVYKAFNEVKAFIKQDVSRPVPVHLRNAPTKLMKELGYGHAYRYAHDEPHAYAAGEQYLPDGLEGQRWYQPVPRGLELRIADKLAELRRLDDEAAAEGEGPAPVGCVPRCALGWRARRALRDQRASTAPHRPECAGRLHRAPTESMPSRL